MRIGFIAVSGLRLCRPEILALGLSFPPVSRRVFPAPMPSMVPKAALAFCALSLLAWSSGVQPGRI